MKSLMSCFIRVDYCGQHPVSFKWAASRVSSIGSLIRVALKSLLRGPKPPRTTLRWRR